MTDRVGASVLRVGLVTSVGMGAAQTAACVQAGLDGFEESAIMNARDQPLVMALLPDDVLPPLSTALEQAAALGARESRMLRLATPAIDEIILGMPDTIEQGDIPVLVATPESHPALSRPLSDRFMHHLEAQSDIGLDWQRSKAFPNGRAGAFRAIQEALELFVRGESDYALIGGIDTPLDLMLIASLDREGRLLAQGVMDGFIPGEGAGFILLGREEDEAIEGLRPLARIVATAAGHEVGHRYAADPYRGDGLAEAFATVLSADTPLERAVQTAYASFNGESFFAKEWSVASIRSGEPISTEIDVRHPADCFGDLGAAMGTVMLGLAALGIEDRSCEAPCLVWGSADGPERGVALLDVARDHA